MKDTEFRKISEKRQLFLKKSIRPNFAYKRFHWIATNLPMLYTAELKNPLPVLLFFYCFIHKTSFILRGAKHCARILERKVDRDGHDHISGQMYKLELMRSGSRALTETRISS